MTSDVDRHATDSVSTWCGNDDETASKMIGIVSRGILRLPHLAAFLGSLPCTVSARSRFPAAEIAAIAGWGRKPSARHARRLARELALPYLALEDGFLRSVAPGTRQVAVSMVVDDVGIYYDASAPSRLELLIKQADPEPALLAMARRGIRLMLQHRLSKYNHAPVASLPQRSAMRRVLVIDQTFGDMSVVLGGADISTFSRMVSAALTDEPCAEIWIKTHPEVIGGEKRGYLAVRDDHPRIRWLAQDCCSLSLIEQFDRVYVVTSQMGFEALLLGKPVVCFGLPWYAGWGLTDDRHPACGTLLARRGGRTVEQLFAAAYLQYTRYVDPASGKRGTLFDAIDWLARNKAMNDALRGVLYCVGMSLWKRAMIRRFLETPSSQLRFVRTLSPTTMLRLLPGARVVLWGSQHPLLRAAALEAGVPVVRLEDGFVRSAGLGSDLHGALSLTVDGPGIHYDPGEPSQLEMMLATVSLTASDRQRVASLRESLVRNGISKYNVGGEFVLSSGNAGRRVLLVPGQVEGDASIEYGSPRIRRNLDLLAAVRSANSDAWIVYKPHPDVVAGNRPGVISMVELDGLANQVATQSDIGACIQAADEVHTMTSLAGFEALLHGKEVHCYGAAFYAGWGLTKDRLPLPHRDRRLSVDELAFVALCRYPRYRLPGVDGFCTIEDVIAHLSSSALQRPVIGSHWMYRQCRKARALAGVLACAGVGPLSFLRMLGK